MRLRQKPQFSKNFNGNLNIPALNIKWVLMNRGSQLKHVERVRGKAPRGIEINLIFST